jgi:metal-responsive CopG/Arc/MetJ family transcriptional regulator
MLKKKRMRTTIDIPNHLMVKLQKREKGKTKRSIIIDALKAYDQKGAARELLKFQGKFPTINVDINTLRDRDHYKKFL